MIVDGDNIDLDSASVFGVDMATDVDCDIQQDFGSQVNIQVPSSVESIIGTNSNVYLWNCSNCSKSYFSYSLLQFLSVVDLTVARAAAL